MAQYYELAASDVHVNNYVILQKAAAGFCDKSTVLLILVLTHHGNKLLRIAVHTTDLGQAIQSKQARICEIDSNSKIQSYFRFGTTPKCFQKSRAKEGI